MNIFDLTAGANHKGQIKPEEDVLMYRKVTSSNPKHFCRCKDGRIFIPPKDIRLEQEFDDNGNKVRDLAIGYNQLKPGDTRYGISYFTERGVLEILRKEWTKTLAQRVETFKATSENVKNHADALPSISTLADIQKLRLGDVWTAQTKTDEKLKELKTQLKKLSMPWTYIESKNISGCTFVPDNNTNIMGHYLLMPIDTMDKEEYLKTLESESTSSSISKKFELLVQLFDDPQKASGKDACGIIKIATSEYRDFGQQTKKKSKAKKALTDSSEDVILDNATGAEANEENEKPKNLQKIEILDVWTGGRLKV